jgi:hypothetical protein
VTRADLQFWADIAQGALTPLVAAIGIYLGIKGHSLAKKRRTDDLFDKRFLLIMDIQNFFDHSIRKFSTTDSLKYWSDEIFPGTKYVFDVSSPHFMNESRLFTYNVERFSKKDPKDESDIAMINSGNEFITRISAVSRAEALNLSLRPKLLFGKNSPNWGDMSEMTLRQINQHINGDEIKGKIIEKASLQ